MMRGNYWIESGMAQEAARELAWFIVFCVVGIVVLVVRDIKKEKKAEGRKPNGRA